MKKTIIITLLVFTIVKLYGQEYYLIDFTSSDANLDSVRVDNLTQETSVMLDGVDVLHLLIESSGFNELQQANDALTIFPNPMNQSCHIEFVNAKYGHVDFQIYSLIGEQIFAFQNVLPKGLHHFCVTGIPSGAYVINIQTETNFFTGKLTSLAETREYSINVKHYNVESSSANLNSSSTKIKSNGFLSQSASKAIIEMEYNVGDELLFVGYSDGFLNSVIFDSPTTDSTYVFIFEMFECGDLLVDSRDSIVYQTVQIGEQCWMAENLAYLPEITPRNSWGSTTESQYAVYGYEPITGTETVEAAMATENYQTYGVLYNWTAATNESKNRMGKPTTVQGVCPDGWHLPSDEDWTELVDLLGGGSVAGGKLKEAGTTHWCSPNEGATNETGFTALPGGARGSGDVFVHITFEGSWWSATINRANSVWGRYMDCFSSNIYRVSSGVEVGISVRCLKNE